MKVFLRIALIFFLIIQVITKISLHADTLLDTYVKQCELLTYEKDALINMQKLFTSDDKSSENAVNFSMECLNPILAQVLSSSIKPSTIFGIHSLIEQFNHPSYDNLILHGVLINESRKIDAEAHSAFKKQLSALNQQACSVFADNYLLSKWLDLENIPVQSWSDLIKNFGYMFLLQSSLHAGMIYFGAPLQLATNSLNLGVGLCFAPANATAAALNFGSSYLGGYAETATQAFGSAVGNVQNFFCFNSSKTTELVKGFILNPFINNNFIYPAWKSRNEIFAVTQTMGKFFEELKRTAEISQSFLNSLNNPIAQNYACNLELPTTITASWDNIKIIVNALDIIGKIDACIAIANSNAIQIQVIESVERNEQTVCSLLNSNLWHLTNDNNQACVWDSEHKMVTVANQPAEKLHNFLTNLILSQTLGVIFMFTEPDEGLLEYLMMNPLYIYGLDLSQIQVATASAYMSNQKFEKIISVRIKV